MIIEVGALERILECCIVLEGDDLGVLNVLFVGNVRLPNFLKFMFVITREKEICVLIL